MTIEERKQELKIRLRILEQAEQEWIESDFYDAGLLEEIEELQIEISEHFQEAENDCLSEEAQSKLLDVIEECLDGIERFLRILNYDTIIACAEAVWEEQITALNSNGLTISSR
ncbi:hypothetical protein ACFL0B_04980 [Thermodesulfobacteriota bacterium]